MPLGPPLGAATAAIEPYAFRTRNLRESENAAHTREGAQARGFRGSIVGGAIVYGQMIRPLIDRFGADWLERSTLDLRFKAPAYDDDLVEARFEAHPPGAAGAPAFRVRALNDRGEELIDMTAELPSRDRLPPADPLAALAPGRTTRPAASSSHDSGAADAAAVEGEGERVLGTFDRMVLHRAFRSYRFSVTLEEQREYCRSTADQAPLYLEGARPPAHPGLVMAQGSRVVANQFVMPFWIHAASVLRHRRVLRVGDDVELRCVPIEKWKRGESEWVRFYQVYLAAGEPAVEVWKTSVIKVAPRAPIHP
jgi:acyl dehydratase